MKINDVECVFHHVGIPTIEKRPQERYSDVFRMHTSDSGCGFVRIQWHRFEEGSPLHPLIQTLPHVAFKVEDLEKVIDGQRLLLAPFEPIPGFRVAMIEDGGYPIEFLQTLLADEEIWTRAIRDGITDGKTAS